MHIHHPGYRRPFTGAYLDIIHRLRHYPSDWTDALNPKCVTSIVFMFFAAFAPALTFGGLVGEWIVPKRSLQMY